MDLKFELLKLELEVSAAIEGIKSNNLGMAQDRLDGVMEEINKIRNQLKK